MDNHDKIFEQFKKAADKEQLADFSSKDKVWSRLEDKLDHKVLKKENSSRMYFISIISGILWYE